MAVAAVDPRAADLIRDLDLIPHPEGGYYREIYRSAATVEPIDGRGRRAALTTIYFLLPAGGKSRWHRVRSEEVWHYYEGAPLELVQMKPSEMSLQRVALGPSANGCVPVHCVPSDCWQAARSTGAYTLVGCTVAPGFEFADFEMLGDRPELVAALQHREAAVTEFL